MSGNHGGSNIYEDQEQVNYGRSRVANEEKHHLTKAEGYRPSEFLTNAACLNRSEQSCSPRRNIGVASNRAYVSYQLQSISVAHTCGSRPQCMVTSPRGVRKSMRRSSAKKRSSYERSRRRLIACRAKNSRS
ncbi:hypothetical protein F4821DRAFT_221935 [Hypoxylon rubiginosum]|uniref:Uncharacterized protein n=1 Tax=Hypoxylon rubiginosum TaxID=110542 RepID=A0ACC0DMJ7_9PEZI|nr:hypothetical protein F4821DRAFT_221935 [Hypoxylon rubiginosum]